MATECIWLRQKQRRLGAVGKNSIKRCEGCPADFLLGIVFWRVRGEGSGPEWPQCQRSAAQPKARRARARSWLGPPQLGPARRDPSEGIRGQPLMALGPRVPEGGRGFEWLTPR